ncbi:lysine N(6)-hydroxylase/L-ornithine N(5)-oxygenase family protein [Aquimarina sp. RZ0]|uniref:lysine N(6)-hydroxylase/L-ornithine N(5)-oxygenase family protein n=1 Tax=Aquimarina sp. RZ0 TaxID=2607730 RepID=UPI0011F374C1|nr:SidA/IucD/PvdA family monooxygenase [Aquimarina sp. RZ0]KAA1243804.1 SidA/IucD/PvdA family monooxygenase [Aquimarina sp. RZ0]
MIQDLVGIGIGPSNLSLASLLYKFEDYQYKFLEAKKEFHWHKGLIFKESNLKVTVVKDLVMLADPTNKFSFISFLHDTGRIYKYLNSKFDTARLKEFEQYLTWVAKNNKNCIYGAGVHEVKFEEGHFYTRYNDQKLISKNIVVGIGNKPNIPSFCRSLKGDQIFHCINFLHKKTSFKNKRIAIIGGGQSGAEIFSHLIHDNELPSEVHWISRRENLLPIDDSSFANEWFMPSYVKTFYGLDSDTKSDLLQKQKMSSDGIHFDLLKKIYQKMYELEFLDETRPFWNLLMSHEMTNVIKNSDNSYQMQIRNNLTKEFKTIDVDYIVLCTGFRNHVPDFFENIMDRIQLSDNKFIVNEDFSIQWEGEENRKIYVQNNALSSMGISDPNLSLMAWRSSIIVNSLMDKEVYKTQFDKPLINWNE